VTLEVTINGRRRMIGLERVGETGFRVTLDGRMLDVDAVPTGAATYSILVLEDRRSSYAASVLDQVGPDEVEVQLRGGSVRAQLDARRRSAGSSAQAVGREGPQRVLAPMPGRIVRVLVSVGDQVSLGQGLVIVEAMKMENELRSPKAGRVAEVGATSGMPVEAGRVLVVIA
jgi:biotin carboxyl carrier protein